MGRAETRNRMETNVFSIENIAELSSSYRLYRIKGLSPEQDEYYRNIGYVRRTLSYQLRNPVTTIERDGLPYLVVRDDADEPPSPFSLVRVVVGFERCSDSIKLDYTVRSPENDGICLRFLQFMVQEPLSSNRWLWQPRSGGPFFKKKPAPLTGDLVRYEGFSVRAVLTPNGGLGFCVDVTSKTAGRRSLPTYISRDEFSEWKGKHCIYHYGHQWYEIQVSGLSDFNVTDHPIPTQGEPSSLLAWVLQESRKQEPNAPVPPDLAQIPPDASVILYQNNRGEGRSAPTSLCYPIYGTDDEEVGRRHGKSMLRPYERRRQIQDFVRRSFGRIQFGDTILHISEEPVSSAPRVFGVPDLEFGGSRILSTQGTTGAQSVELDELGQTRLALLKDSEAGFFCADPLDRQYFIFPRTVFESYGTRFLDDLKRTVDEFFPTPGGYNPIVVTYDDNGPKTFPTQGNAILKAARAECDKPGYGVVMVHRTSDRRLREEDQLAAMVVRELRDRFDICVAAIHTEVGQECYRSKRRDNGETYYVARGNKYGKLAGYLRNVALNKVLLINQRWPFVLATPLNADIIVGVDVKQNTAGLVVVSDNGAKIRALLRTSRQKERLRADQLETYLTEILHQELQVRTEPVRTIVLHRDGRVYQSERTGAHRAIEALKDRGELETEATLTILEIPKTSPVWLRLFDVSDRNGRPWIENPLVGYHYLVDEMEGYLCTTGRPFLDQGTARPLHVRRVDGPLPMRECLEDIYSLSTLAWTRPEGCTRYPITLKLNDRFLREEATEYDADALEFAAAREGDTA